jgi:hypothetical protein
MTIPGTAVTAHGLRVYDGPMNTPPGLSLMALREAPKGPREYR